MGHDGFSLIRPRGFGRSVSSGQGPLTVAVLHPPHPNQRYQPLPQPTGRAPFHLQLSDVLPPATVDAITRAGKVAFHVVGDVGGVKFPEPQTIVAAHLEQNVRDSSAKAGPCRPFCTCWATSSISLGLPRSTEDSSTSHTSTTRHPSSPSRATTTAMSIRMHRRRRCAPSWRTSVLARRT